eukprot:TRINITY_DN1112_c0_g1_i3.p1 TRINITY_DN1112_c0_g1~~TRINITY_DN1112_c0_g1_i3.p1  ORF type:complete len:112 (-),score=10.07 TRINITY_DN1112_c0_g1_i3:57-392(-)
MPPHPDYTLFFSRITTMCGLTFLLFLLLLIFFPLAPMPAPNLAVTSLLPRRSFKPRAMSPCYIRATFAFAHPLYDDDNKVDKKGKRGAIMVSPLSIIILLVVSLPLTHTQA